MKQVLIRGGGVVVHEVPAPLVRAKTILVGVEYSCISVGTEMSGVRMSGLPLYRRAMKQPENVAKVLNMMRDQGIRRTLDRVSGKLNAGSPTGYSAAGIVLAIGPGIDGFAPGDRVACAGAGIANHAEVIDVPMQLAAKIPAELSSSFASTVTLGAIAMQGVRRAAPTLGETVLVVGLGILGQLTAQLLRASGCRVIGVDLDPERIRLAQENGMAFSVDPSSEDYVDRVHKLTDGIGADAAIVTAATPSSTVINEAMQACRKKARIVLVGDVGLNLSRANMYSKELDLLISCSYGPGRYDPEYEEEGRDYPIGYVRWTENRNMREYLKLLAEKKIDLSNLCNTSFDIDHASEAYEALGREGDKPLLVLLSYPRREDALIRKVTVNRTDPKPGKIGVALAGAGSFAQGVHLPNMVKLRRHYDIRGILNRTGANARAVATQYGAAYATTDYAEILTDPKVDLVMIATRHDTHARMTLQALAAGKNVFVEKPLCLTTKELESIKSFYERRKDGPMLMVGFNRRFSPALRRAAEVLAGRTTPLMVNYRMNAGYIPLDHWVHKPEGGGRNIGEACHIYDLFNFLTGSKTASVSAAAITPGSGQWAPNDNFVATVTYVDGSVCTLTYTALGCKSHPKERMEIYADGKVISLDDYRSLKIDGGRHKGWSSHGMEKGQFEELQALAACLTEDGEWPIPFAQQIQATEIALRVEELIKEDGRTCVE